MRELGVAIVLIAIAMGFWFWLGDPRRDLQNLVGQVTSADRSPLVDYVSRNRESTNGDVWLVHVGLAPHDRVALFFGYADNWYACQSFAETYAVKYSAAANFCERAN